MPQSLTTLAYGVKKAAKQRIGLAYNLDFEIKLIVDEFFKQFISDRRGTTKPKAVPIADLRLLAAKSGPRTACFIEFLLNSALRVSEACAIKREDVRFLDDRVEIAVVQKGGYENTVVVPAELVRGVNDVFHGETYLFETSKRKKYRRQDVYNLITDASKRHR